MNYKSKLTDHLCDFVHLLVYIFNFITGIVITCVPLVWFLYGKDTGLLLLFIAIPLKITFRCLLDLFEE